MKALVLFRLPHINLHIDHIKTSEQLLSIELYTKEKNEQKLDQVRKKTYITFPRTLNRLLRARRKNAPCWVF